jgi:hypothetical protein
MTDIELFNHNQNEVDRIENILNTVMEPRTGRVTRQNIIDRLTRLNTNDLNNLNFARALVQFVTRRNSMNIRIDDILTRINLNKMQEKISGPLTTWRFRHYTSNADPTHPTTGISRLQSLAQLTLLGHHGTSTNARDWEEIGNTGYVFGLVVLNGHVPKRSWLSNMRHYAEYDMRTLNSVWVSEDMLVRDARNRNSYQGIGEFVIRKLSTHVTMFSEVPNQMGIWLNESFNNTLEAKVSPASLGAPVWIRV